MDEQVGPVPGDAGECAALRLGPDVAVRLKAETMVRTPLGVGAGRGTKHAHT